MRRCPRPASVLMEGPRETYKLGLAGPAVMEYEVDVGPVLLEAPGVHVGHGTSQSRAVPRGHIRDRTLVGHHGLGAFHVVGFLAAVPFSLVAVFLFPSAPVSVMGRLRLGLDSLIVAGSLLFASWATVLGPAYHGGGSPFTLLRPGSEINDRRSHP